MTTTSMTTTTTSGCSASYSSFNGIADDCNVSAGIARAFPTAVLPNYYAVFNGQGVTEDPNNPGNDGPVITTTFDDISADQNCAAITRCANTCLPNNWSFDLHYFCALATWECICYYDNQYSGDYFNVPNPLISQVYGFNYYVQ